ncbi:MAG TPA: hypothetical protein VGG43_09365 [Acidimicrobiales bacterium]
MTATLTETPTRPAAPETPPPLRRRWRGLLAAGGSYLAVSVIVWWNVWFTHPTSTTTCGCGDSSLITWFLAWPAYAISHGLNPLYSSALFHPTGVNLPANTSELAFGVLLTPLTWAFGPIATLNVALTLSPFLSALAMFVLLRRWVGWQPAAFVGGLFYGFSPLILVSLTDAHLMVGTLVVPPLIIACLDELMIRQRRPARRVGVLLGALVGLQFFIGTEVLTMTVIFCAIGAVLVLLYGLGHRRDVRLRRHHAVVGLATGAVTAIVLLAYPLWFALDGPAHFSGALWTGLFIGFGGVAFKDYVLPLAASQRFTNLAHRVGGYQGNTLSGQYFGIGLLAVVVGGFAVWRRDRRLWLFGAIALISVWLSLGLESSYWVPWRVLVKLPLIQNIIPGRFVIVTYLAAAVLLGVIVDRIYTRASQPFASAPDAPGVGSAKPRLGPIRPWAAGAVAGVVVAGIAVVPIAVYLAGTIPVVTQPVVLPTWFRTVAPQLPGHQVLLVYPAPFTIVQSAMTWQAVNGMHYSMVGGSGPGGVLSRAGKERDGQAAITINSLTMGRPSESPTDILAVRQALRGWGVTMVVIPDQPGLPRYEQVASVPSSLALMTAAIGNRPIHQADAWVWTGVGNAVPSGVPTSAAYQACLVGPGGTPTPTVTIAGCILTASRTR